MPPAPSCTRTMQTGAALLLLCLVLLNSGCAVWNPWGYSKDWGPWKKTLFFIGPGHCPVCYCVGGAAIEVKRKVSGNRMEAVADAATQASRVEVLYLHGTLRCDTCLEIERIAEATVRAAFADAMAAGTITWRSVDYDLPENAAYDRQFDPPYPVLVMARMTSDGQYGQWRLAEKTWDSMHEGPEALADYVRLEIEGFLSAEPPERQVAPPTETAVP